MNVSRSTHAVPQWQRRLLPAIIGVENAQRDADGGTDLPRSLRDWVVDLMLFTFAVLAGIGFLVDDHHKVGAAFFAIDGVLTIPACLALWVRRRHPVAVGWLAVGLALVSEGAGGAALVALFTVAVHCPLRRTLQIGLLSAVDAAVGSLIYDGARYDYGSLLTWLTLTVAVVGFGLYIRSRRELLLSLRERARRAEDEQQLRVREARLAERARIAREMHDVLAHRISLLSVHAGALEFNPNATPEEIARAASVIRVSARAAQEELREVIGVLRASAEIEDAQPPQPTIADLGRLVQESLNAGMEVSLVNALERESLSPILGRTIYRLVQEALTNVRKHAPGQVVTIAIEGDRTDGVQVEVVNRPRVGQAGTASADSDSRDGGHVGSGTGLVGLAERVKLVGGQLTTEALPAGGFRLLASVPWSGPGPEEEPPA